jgi:hypothetical protein
MQGAAPGEPTRAQQRHGRPADDQRPYDPLRRLVDDRDRVRRARPRIRSAGDRIGENVGHGDLRCGWELGSQIVLPARPADLTKDALLVTAYPGPRRLMAHGDREAPISGRLLAFCLLIAGAAPACCLGRRFSPPTRNLTS